MVVARGRDDHTDVPPLKGLYHGPPDSDMEVTVEVTRLALSRTCAGRLSRSALLSRWLGRPFMFGQLWVECAAWRRGSRCSRPFRNQR